MKPLKFILCCMLLSSCATYYFHQPLPTDAENIYVIPKKFRGTWKDDVKHTSLDIGKDYYKRTETIPVSYSKSEFESDSGYFFIDDKVYRIRESAPEGGYSFYFKNDSIFINTEQINYVQLGENAFLRKIDYGYILNLRNEKMKDWWSATFIDVRNKTGVAFRELREGDLEKNGDYKLAHPKLKTFIIADWKQEDIERFIDKGGFSDTVEFLNYGNKIAR